MAVDRRRNGPPFYAAMYEAEQVRLQAEMAAAVGGILFKPQHHGVVIREVPEIEPIIDMVEVNGLWMTPEDARKLCYPGPHDD
jgi:hypothetical protein